MEGFNGWVDRDTLQKTCFKEFWAQTKGKFKHLCNVFLLEPNLSFANFCFSKEAEKLTLIIFYAITFIQPEMKEWMDENELRQN